VEINGVAHVYLTVSNYEACVLFYERLLPFLGLKHVTHRANMVRFIGGRTSVGIVKCDEKYGGERFVQQRVGLHHVCWRARNRADIDEVYKLLLEIGARVIHPPEDGSWAPGYYSVLFEDPDGIRLEVNHIPGKGLLAEKPTA
jgi:catechol 2,3-dioxygenase-like lactoylglutathione lyase family enzyme